MITYATAEDIITGVPLYSIKENRVVVVYDVEICQTERDRIYHMVTFEHRRGAQTNASFLEDMKQLVLFKSLTEEEQFYIQLGGLIQGIGDDNKRT